MPENASEISPLPSSVRKRRTVTLLIVSAGVAVLSTFWFVQHSTYSLSLKTCFQNAHGLNAGALVKIAGVDVGRVRNVQAQPTEPTCPAVVTVELQTPYRLTIPRDAIASIDSDGIFGHDFIAIDATRASAPSIENGGKLPSKESERLTTDAVDHLAEGIEVMKKLSDEERKAEMQQKELSKHSPSQPPRSK